MMDSDVDSLALEYIDKYLIEENDPNIILASLSVGLADNIWHIDKSDYSQEKASGISTVTESAPLVN